MSDAQMFGLTEYLERRRGCLFYWRSGDSWLCSSLSECAAVALFTDYERLWFIDSDADEHAAHLSGDSGIAVVLSPDFDQGVATWWVHARYGVEADAVHNWHRPTMEQAKAEAEALWDHLHNGGSITEWLGSACDGGEL